MNSLVIGKKKKKKEWDTGKLKVKKYRFEKIENKLFKN